MPRDLERARSLYERGCNANSGEACEKLGDQTRDASPQQALNSYLRGCDASFRRACQMGDKEGCKLAKP